MSWFRDSKNGDFSLYMKALEEQYKYFQKKYLLEAIKAKEAIPLIKQYLKSGKKVVVFHDYKKGGGRNPFIIETDYLNGDAIKQYQAAKAARPDLFKLNLSNLDSPIETITKAFGDDALFFNGDVNKKVRQKAVDDFQNDNSGKNLIIVQSDAGQAGISLHDTTGKYQRVLINLGMPTKPVASIQIEGRIYRTGQKSNAIFRYLNTGTNLERRAFASTIAERASTAENLALGNEARALKESFIDAFNESDDGETWRRYLPGTKGEGTGGKDKDKTALDIRSDFDKAKAFYYGQQKKNSKNKAAEGNDYFATPEPLGYKMVEWAKITSGESILEPSAGHGAIARWFPLNTKNTAIEPSGKLAPKVQMAMQSGSNVIQSDFESHNIINKYNAIIMNPPFGTGGKTAVEHVAKAFKHLRDHGRIVAIVPNGQACKKSMDKFLYDEENGEQSAVVRREIDLPGCTFERAGTKVGTKIYIIDKVANKNERSEITPAAHIELTDIQNDVVQ